MLKKTIPSVSSPAPHNLERQEGIHNLFLEIIGYYGNIHWHRVKITGREGASKRQALSLVLDKIPCFISYTTQIAGNCLYLKTPSLGLDKSPGLCSCKAIFDIPNLFCSPKSWWSGFSSWRLWQKSHLLFLPEHQHHKNVCLHAELLIWIQCHCVNYL